MEETMKNITKSITGTIVGAAALMLAACSSSPSTAPEASATIGQEDSSKQIRLESKDSTYTPPVIAVSAETEETLESWLNGNPISNGITVDNWCYPENPDDPLWCYPARLQLESGTVANAYGGSVNVIMCETETDTISYGVHLHSNIITKTWTNPLFNTEMHAQSKLQFKESCKAENGDITEDTEHKIACDIKIEPIPSEDAPTEDSRRYYRTHYFYNYIDPSWTNFATKTVERCRIRPQIEPTASPKTGNTSLQIVQSIRPDSTITTPPAPAIDSAEADATINGYTDSYSISELIAIEPIPLCSASQDYPGDMMWCYKLQLEQGRTSRRFLGSSDKILCERNRNTEDYGILQDTISYKVSIDSNIVTKTLTNTMQYFNPNAWKHFNDLKSEFSDSCVAEGGQITEDSWEKTTCKIEIAPCDNEYCREQPEPTYNYNDPNWKRFVLQTVKACRISPEITDEN